MPWDKKENVFFFVHSTMLDSLCSDDKVTASTVSPGSCLPLPCKGTGLREDSWPTLKKWEVEDLTTNLWCWCEGAFCRWLNAASAVIQAHSSLLNICAIPFVTPEVLLSPAIQGRFFIPSQIYWKKVLHHYLDVFLQSYFLIAYSQWEIWPVKMMTTLVLMAFLCLPVDVKLHMWSWMPHN